MLHAFLSPGKNERRLVVRDRNEFALVGETVKGKGCVVIAAALHLLFHSVHRDEVCDGPQNQTE